MPIPVFVAALLAYAAIAMQDLRQRRVSNILCLVIFGLGIVRWAALMEIGPVSWALVGCLALFGLGILFFSLGWLGGGDVKLIAATSFLLGAPDTLLFLFIMSVIGSALALLLLIQKYAGGILGRRSAEPDSDGSDDHAKVPYAVAVALAATIVSFIQIQRA